MEVNVKVGLLLPVGVLAALFFPAVFPYVYPALKKIGPKFCTDLFQTLGLWRLYSSSMPYFFSSFPLLVFFFLLPPHLLLVP